MSTPEPVWAKVGSAYKYHYFPEQTGLSLCKQWFKFQSGGLRENNSNLAEDQKCVVCQRTLRGRRQRAQALRKKGV